MVVWVMVVSDTDTRRNYRYQENELTLLKEGYIFSVCCEVCFATVPVCFSEGVMVVKVNI